MLNLKCTETEKIHMITNFFEIFLYNLRKMVNTFVIGRKLEYLQYLDMKRLGKQRVEAAQIIAILEHYDEFGELPNKGWANHKVTKMWMGHTKALKMYFNYAVTYWIERGYKNTYELYENVECEIIKCTFDGKRAIFEKEANENTFPIWFSFPPFHYAHRAALYMKDPEFYRELLNEKIEPYVGKGYLWPGDHGNEIYRKWSMKFLAEPGEGLPSYYRLSIDLIKQWVKDKETNPSTGRKIKVGKKTYKDFENAAKHYGLL